MTTLAGDVPVSEAVDFRRLQAEVGRWHRDMFPTATPTQVILKAVEEVAELAAAHNHRMTNRPLPCRWCDGGDLKELDAVGDVMIVLAVLCDRWGVDLAEVVGRVWAEVRGRSRERVHRNSTVADSLEVQS